MGKIYSWGKPTISYLQKDNEKIRKKEDYQMITQKEYILPQQKFPINSTDSNLTYTKEPFYIKVSCGARSFCAIDLDGNFYTWGDAT